MKPVAQMLCLWVEVQLEVPHGIVTIGEKHDLWVHLIPLRLQDLEQAPFRLRIQSLHTPKALAGRDILLVVPSEGEYALANDDCEIMLQTWTGECDSAKQCAEVLIDTISDKRQESTRVMPFDTKGLPAVRTLGMGCNKGGGLLLHKVVLHLEQRWARRLAHQLSHIERPGLLLVPQGRSRY